MVSETSKLKRVARYITPLDFIARFEAGGSPGGED
jgi:hypothetical protein